MSEEQLKAFLEKVKADTSLQEKLKAAASSDAVLAIAKEAGFSISDDDMKNAQSKISEEELERDVVGGKTICLMHSDGTLEWKKTCWWSCGW
jgi:predicted ribosomally synthesized peptide with nif11-like leader